MVGGIAITDSREVRLARNLRTACLDVPVGSDVSGAEAFAECLRMLEMYLTLMLREVHQFWKYESLDGVYCEFAIKTGPLQVQLAGQCILITDQTLTPYHLELRAARDADEIEWLDCRLGEVCKGQLVRVPYREWKTPSVVNRLGKIEWKFHVGFGLKENV